MQEEKMQEGMSPRDQRLVLDAIESSLGGRRLTCPVSGDSEWKLEPSFGIVSAVPSVELRGVPGSGAFPFAIVMCNVCGYSMMFNVFGLGINEELEIWPSEEELVDVFGE